MEHRGGEEGGEKGGGGRLEVKMGDLSKNGNQMSRSKGSTFSTARSFVESV